MLSGQVIWKSVLLSKNDPGRVAGPELGRLMDRL